MRKVNLMLLAATTLTVNTSYEGETIENKIERIVTQNEPITDGAPQIFTDRKDGVSAEYDIRTDRFEIAVEAMDKVNRAKLAKREEKLKEPDVKTEVKTDGIAESIQATN